MNQLELTCLGVDALRLMPNTHLHVHVLGSRCVHGQVGQVDVGLERRGQLHLGLLGGLAHALQGHAVLAQVNALGRREIKVSSRNNLIFGQGLFEMLSVK